MFWKKKEKLEKMKSDMLFQNELQEISEMIENVSVETTDHGKALKKYSYSMDEVIDLMEKVIENQKEKEEWKAVTEKQLHRLREIILYYQEQTYRLNQVLLEDENWNSSVQMMEKDEDVKLQSNGMTAIHTIDAVFSFELHDVIGIVDTEFVERDGRIAAVHVPGLIDDGNVIRKAKVAVYCYSEDKTKIPVEKGEKKDGDDYRN